MIPLRYRDLRARARWRGHETVALVASLPMLTSATRARLLQLIGHRVVGARINPFVRLLGPGRLTVGRASFVNSGCCFDLTADVHLGGRVHVGPQACIYTSTHRLGTPDCMAGEIVRAPVTIADGVWIGANAVVLPGVTIGAGIVVGAGAVVTHDLDEPGVYVGVPARRVCAQERYLKS